MDVDEVALTEKNNGARASHCQPFENGTTHLEYVLRFVWSPFTPVFAMTGDF